MSQATITRHAPKKLGYFYRTDKSATYWDSVLHEMKMKNFSPTEIRFKYKKTRYVTEEWVMLVTSFVRIVKTGFFVDETPLPKPVCWIATAEVHTSEYAGASPYVDAKSRELLIEGLGAFNYIKVSPLDIVSIEFTMDEGPQE